MANNRIKEFRLKRNMTQSELAKAAQTSQQQIQRIEAGVQKVRFELAANICAALGERLERIFPAVALPLRRARKRLKSSDDLLTDDTARHELNAAGIDTEFTHPALRYRLRGGFEGVLFFAPGESNRLWDAIQDDEEQRGFIVFDALDRRYAVNLAHLVFCQFLHEPPGITLDEDEDEDERQFEYEARFVLAESDKVLSFGVEPDWDSIESYDPKPESVQLQDLVYYAQMGVDRVLHFSDEDGETAWFRTHDIAMFSLPLKAVEPKLSEDANDA